MNFHGMRPLRHVPFHLPFYFKSDSAKTDTRGTVALWHEYHSLFNSEQ
jgi:hypothetical protein